MFYNFSGIEMGVLVYISGTMLILSQDKFIEIATGYMSFIISGSALILSLVFCDETATGCVGL